MYSWDCHVLAWRFSRSHNCLLGPQRRRLWRKTRNYKLNWEIIWSNSNFKSHTTSLLGRSNLKANNLLVSGLTTLERSASMSAEVHLERQKRNDLGATSSSFAPAFTPRVPTVTLISHREPREKRTAHRLQPGSLDHKLVASSLYRYTEGRSPSSYRSCFMKSSGYAVTAMSDGGYHSCLVCSLNRSDWQIISLCWLCCKGNGKFLHITGKPANWWLKP